MTLSSWGKSAGAEPINDKMSRAIAEIELRVREQFGGSLVLADERAMSQTRSPFRTVGSLADYALQVHEPK